MMRGVAVIRVKAGQSRPESAKQAEIRLASLLKILTIGPRDCRNTVQGLERLKKGCIFDKFRGIWLIQGKYCRFC
jgi:hypothetical protein